MFFWPRIRFRIIPWSCILLVWSSKILDLKDSSIFIFIPLAFFFRAYLIYRRYFYLGSGAIFILFILGRDTPGSAQELTPGFILGVTLGDVQGVIYGADQTNWLLAKNKQPNDLAPLLYLQVQISYIFFCFWFWGSTWLRNTISGSNFSSVLLGWRIYVLRVPSAVLGIELGLSPCKAYAQPIRSPPKSSTPFFDVVQFSLWDGLAVLFRLTLQSYSNIMTEMLEELTWDPHWIWLWLTWICHMEADVGCSSLAWSSVASGNFFPSLNLRMLLLKGQ